MKKIAITGNIASGKSTVEKIIKDLGFKVFDTDKIAHKVLESSDEIKKHFHTTNRKKIAEVVFNNKEELKILESIIHPKVKAEIEKIFQLDEKIIFISVPQLFEAGFDSMFDKIIFISADINTRVKRLMERNNYTEEFALKRINAQKEEKDKIEKSDFIITNNENIDTLKLKIIDILSKI